MKEILQSLDKFTAYLRKKGVPADVADDILQDSVIKALKNSESLRAEDKLIPWFYTILNNAFLDLLKREKISPVKPFKSEDQSQNFADHQIPQDEQQKLCTCLLPAINALDDDDKTIITLVDIEERSREEVALQLGKTKDALRVSLHRARAKLRDSLQTTCQSCAKAGCLDCTCGH